MSEGFGHWPPAHPHSHPNLGQVHGPLLRLNQVSPADSGEYSCQVTSGSDILGTSVQVTIQASSPDPIPGEWQEQRAVVGHWPVGGPFWLAPPSSPSGALALGSLEVLQLLPATGV